MPAYLLIWWDNNLNSDATATLEYKEVILWKELLLYKIISSGWKTKCLLSDFRSLILLNWPFFFNDLNGRLTSYSKCSNITLLLSEQDSTSKKNIASIYTSFSNFLPWVESWKQQNLISIPLLSFLPLKAYQYA